MDNLYHLFNYMIIMFFWLLFFLALQIVTKGWVKKRLAKFMESEKMKLTQNHQFFQEYLRFLLCDEAILVMPTQFVL